MEQSGHNIQLETAADTGPIRPMALFDLFVITTAFAIVLVIATSVNKLIQESEPSAAQFWGFWQFASCLLTSIAIASTVLIVRQRIQTGRMFLHPGHWSLFTCATLHIVQFACFTALTITFRSQSFEADSIWVKLYAVVMIVANIVCAVIMSYATIRCNALWRAACGIVAVCMILNSCYFAFIFLPIPDVFVNIIYYGFLVVCLLCVVLVITATLVDAIQRIRRGYLHWFGVLMLLLTLGFHPLVAGLFL